MAASNIDRMEFRKNPLYGNALDWLDQQENAIERLRDDEKVDRDRERFLLGKKLALKEFRMLLATLTKTEEQ